MCPLRFIGIVGRNDVGMFQLRRGFNLAMKSSEGLLVLDDGRRQNFDRHDAFHPLVLSLEYHPHATLTEFVEDQIVAQDQ